MKKTITVFCIIFFVALQATFVAADDATWDNYQDILKSAVTVKTFISIDGEFSHTSVDYEKIKNNSALQEKIIIQLDKLKEIKAPEEEKYKLAFWINAYNFFTIVDIVNNYPITSMKKIGWKNKHHQVESSFYSLDNIEHNVIRPLTDPRIHFAINCASVGCPSLSKEIFTGNQIDKQLDDAATNALKNPLHLRLISKDNIHATQIFHWFMKDFETGGYRGVAYFINKFATERFSTARHIDNKIKYDWNLNTEQNVFKKMNELSIKFPELKLKRK